MKQYYIYILSSKSKVLYIWVTSDLIKRVYEHKNKFVEWFTNKYSVDRLVYYENYNNVRNALEREKQLKKWKRQFKIDLINNFNPAWQDLYSDIIN
jgi:putative endonuclease